MLKLILLIISHIIIFTAYGADCSKLSDYFEEMQNAMATQDCNTLNDLNEKFEVLKNCESGGAMVKTVALPMVDGMIKEWNCTPSKKALLEFPEGIFVTELLNEFKNNAYDAREKYKNEITLNGYIRAIGNQFADFDYIVLGGKEMFFLEGVFLKNINSDLLLYLSVGDKFTVKGILSEKIHQGVSFNVSQIITNIKKYELAPLNSSKQNPIDVFRIFEEKNKNEIRAKYLFSKNGIYITGMSGKTSESKNYEGKFEYNLKLLPLKKSDLFSLTKNIGIKIPDPKTAEKLTKGEIIIVSGNLEFISSDIVAMVKPTFHKGLVESVKLKIASALNNPLSLEKIFKDFDNNEKVANRKYKLKDHFIEGKVRSIGEMSGKKYVLMSSLNPFDDVAYVYFSDNKIYDKIDKDMKIIISGLVQSEQSILKISNAKLDTGEFKKVEKLTSSIKNPFNVKDIVNIFETNPMRAIKMYSGEIFVVGNPKVRTNWLDAVGELIGNNYSLSLYSGELFGSSMKVSLNDTKLYPYIKKDKPIILKGSIDGSSTYILRLLNAKIVSKFKKENIPKITSSLSNPINAEKLIDDFEENTARARLMYPGRIFVTGFSDGVKEHTGSEGTSFYLQLKGTKDDLFDMDYLYIEAKNMQQFANIKKGQPITASGKLGEVRSLGASLEDSKIIMK